jgi:hypothetical protein
MWTKVYVGTLAVFALFLGVVVYYASSWLGSITAPLDAFAGYEYNRSLSWWILWISTAVLVVLANILLANTGKAWALWATFGYTCFFVMIIGFLLPLTAIGFLREHNFAPELTQYLSPFLAIGICVGFGAFIYVNQLVATRMRRGVVEKDIEEEPGADLTEDADSEADLGDPGADGDGGGDGE